MRMPSVVSPLPESNAFALLFERNPLPMWIYSLDALTFLAVNDAAIAQYGYSRDEFLRMNLRDISVSDPVALLIGRFSRKRATKGVNGQQRFRHRKRNGALFDVEISANDIKFSGRLARLAIVRDITVSKQLEERLCRDQTFLDGVLNAMPDGMVAYDSEGGLTYFNRGLCEILALPDHDMASDGTRLLGSLCDAESRAPMAPGALPLRRALAGESVHDAEAVLERMDATHRHVLINAEPMLGPEGSIEGAIGVIRDVTTRRQAAQALLESEARYRGLFEHAVEGVFRTALDGRFLIANPACARILGYESPAQLTAPDAPLAGSFYPDTGDRAALLEALRRHGSIRDQRLRLRRRDGEIIWVNEKIRALYDARGELTGMEGSIEDVTVSVRAHQALRASEERFARAIEGANDGLWDWNLRTGTAYYSPRWKSQLGYGPGELDADIDEWLNRVHPEDRALVEGELEALRSDQSAHMEAEHRLRHKDGQYRWMLARGVRSHSDVDDAVHIAGSQTDISVRKRAEQRLQHDALHDALTGLPNRALLKDRINQALYRYRRDADRKFAVLYLDLDRFKLINDSLGHAAGDELLMEISRRWRRQVREYDTLARLGGDEFVLLLENLHDVDEALHKAKGFLSAIEQPIVLAGQQVVVGSSIGIVFADKPEWTAEDLLRDADTAMYRSKMAGRNRATVYDQSMHESTLHTFELEKDLRAALGTEQLCLHYQAINRLDDREVSGFEALLRWQHPSKGLISPMEFIPLAEETGLILELDMSVVQRACRQLAAWRASGRIRDDVTMSVNLSAKQLGRLDLPQRIQSILEDTGLPGTALKLEVTETAIIENLDTAGEIILNLKKLHVGVVLDDFGTGYSSLSHLYQFPFDGIKVDQSFVRQLSAVHNANHVMELIRLLGEKMCISVVPEGIETEAQLSYLKELGFEHAQGFLFGLPRPPDSSGAPAS